MVFCGVGTGQPLEERLSVLLSVRELNGLFAGDSLFDGVLFNSASEMFSCVLPIIKIFMALITTIHDSSLTLIKDLVYKRPFI